MASRHQGGQVVLAEDQVGCGDGVEDLGARHPKVVTNVRGRGLLCAVDVTDRATRDGIAGRLMTEAHVLMLGCGDRTLRFRPSLAERRLRGVDGLRRTASACPGARRPLEVRGMTEGLALAVAASLTVLILL